MEFPQLVPEKIDSHTPPEEMERISSILEDSSRPLIKRIGTKLLHAVNGHPESNVYWGTISEGATCACGAHKDPAASRHIF